MLELNAETPAQRAERILRESLAQRRALAARTPSTRIDHAQIAAQVQAELAVESIHRLGGLSQSPAKQRAARRNGAKGGRPRRWVPSEPSGSLGVAAIRREVPGVQRW